MSRSLKIAMAAALCLGLLGATPSIAAPDGAHVNYLTFRRPVSLPGGIELPPGTYVFELANFSDYTLVRVSSRTAGTVYFTAFTNRIDRPKGDEQGSTLVTLAQDAPGQATPIAAWYPIGESMGFQFIYKR